MVLATSMKESKSERPGDADQTLFAKSLQMGRNAQGHHQLRCRCAIF